MVIIKGEGMMFYHIQQYGQRICAIEDDLIVDLESAKIICRKIVEKAKEQVKEKKMSSGAFDVIVCNESGQEIETFLSGTDYKY